ncbi:MAG: FimV/HubP family polar landmark protein [Porticoccaceae bacterium]
MRQIRAFRSGWTGANSLSKSIAFAVIFSLGCSVAADESDGGPQEIQVSTIQPSHTVVIGDTLWNVALRLRPQGMAMAQAMDAVYEHNPEAFLEADSTKLIEGSVVTFPIALAVTKAPEVVVSAENSSLSIPQLDPIAVPSVESTELIAEEPVQKQDTAVDDLPVEKALPEAEVEIDVNVAAEVEVDEKIQESLLVVEPETASQLPNAKLEELPVDDVVADAPMLLIENAVEDKSSEAVVEQPSTQPIQVKHTEINQPVQVEPVNQLEQFLAQLRSQDASQIITKLKQLPIDLWFFVAAILIAIIINRSKRRSGEDSSSQSSEDSLAESVLDGPFAEGDAQDDVFTAPEEQSAKAKVKDEPPASDEEQEPAEIAMNLPGLDELKAQLSEDNDPAKPLAKDFEPVSFEEDTLEIDPLQIKLDMASLCIEMGDIESAQSILEEIISEADKQGKAKAREILDSIET